MLRTSRDAAATGAARTVPKNRRHNRRQSGSGVLQSNQACREKARRSGLGRGGGERTRTADPLHAKSGGAEGHSSAYVHRRPPSCGEDKAAGPIPCAALRSFPQAFATLGRTKRRSDTRRVRAKPLNSGRSSLSPLIERAWCTAVLVQGFAIEVIRSGRTEPQKHPGVVSHAVPCVSKGHHQRH